MKTIKVMLVFYLVCFYAFIQAQNSFYYYQGNKINLIQTTDKMYVKFIPNADNTQIISLINGNNSVKLVSSVDSTNSKIEFLLFENNNNLTIPESAFVDFKANANVVSVTPIFEYNGTLQGLTDEFVVKLKSTTSYSQLQTLATANNCVIKEESPFVELQYMMSVSKTSNLNALQTANLFFETGLFEFAEPDFVILNAFNSNDPYFAQQWALKNTGQYGGVSGIDIKAEQAWSVTQGNNIKIAIIDSGVELNHPDLTNIIAGYDASGNNSGGAPVWSSDMHGTACAGIFGAKKDNGIGIAGVAPDCKIMTAHVSIQSNNNNESLNSSWAANGINWAWQNGADVISNSWRSGAPYEPITNAINAAVTKGRNGKGCVVVFAAGNENRSVSYPATLANVIAVGAISPCGERKRSSNNASEVNQDVTPDPAGVSCDRDKSWGSNYGAELDIVAPGVLIATTDRQGSAGYNTASGTAGNYTSGFGGTSAACPYVAGVAALVLSVNPNLTWQQVRNTIERTAQKVRSDLYTYYTISDRPNGTWNYQTGYGLVNAYAAVQAAVPHIDLFIRDNDQDVGFEPNPLPNSVNSSPDIMLVDLFGNVITNLSSYTNPSCYIKVNIKNIGNIDISGTERLHLFWNELALVSNQSQLPLNPLSVGESPSVSRYSCTRITPPEGLPIFYPYSNHSNQVVTAGNVQFAVPDNTEYRQLLNSSFTVPLTPCNWGFSIIAVADENNGTTPDFSNNEPLINSMASLARNYNSIAVSDGSQILIAQDYSNVFAVAPAMNTPFSIRINQIPTGNNFVLNDFAELNVLLSNDLIKNLDFQKSGIKQVNENTVRLPSADTELFFNPVSDENGLYFAGAEVHFISDKMPELNEFDFDMTLVTDGEADQSMRITAVRDENIYFKAHAEVNNPKVVKAKEEVTLTANQIIADAEYIWYDEVGNVVGKGYQITLMPDYSQTYKIEIEQKDNGYKSYDEVQVIAVDGVIKSLAPNPANDYVTVSYLLSDNATDASIQVSDMYGNISASYPLQISMTKQQISLSGLMPGTYLVKLLISGTAVDSKNLLKQ
ncbi:MAG: S8 family serine peptidase [Paludibacter sp.]|nr:S8 family serine peptidase [Paludibacter sp.]